MKIKQFSIITYGCTHNLADSQKIESILSSLGMKKSNVNDSELIIVNTCAVKHTTEQKILDFISKTSEIHTKKKILVTGCLPFISDQIFDKISSFSDRIKIFHSYDLRYIEDIIENRPFTNNRKDGLIFKAAQKFNCDQNSINSILQISEGCNNQCTYCCTKIARENLISFPNSYLENIFSYFLKENKKEIYITSQDIGNYNYGDLKLHNLLENFLSQNSQKFYIRLGMINPDYLIDYFSEFIEIFRDSRIYRFLHIPIQSASDNVLKSMKRNYSISDIKNLVKKFKEFDPKFRFSTDVIIGYPTESNRDFSDTYEFIEKWNPDMLNISKYSVRPNTFAKSLSNIDSKTIKERTKIISQKYEQQKRVNLEKWIGWEGKVLISDFNPKNNYPYLSRNSYYLPIHLHKAKLGVFEKIQIEKIEKNMLIGKSIE